MSETEKPTEESKVELSEEQLDAATGGASGRSAKLKGLTQRPQGTASVQEHKKEIEVLSWSWGISKSGTQ